MPKPLQHRTKQMAEPLARQVLPSSTPPTPVLNLAAPADTFETIAVQAAATAAPLLQLTPELHIDPCTLSTPEKVLWAAAQANQKPLDLASLQQQLRLSESELHVHIFRLAWRILNIKNLPMAQSWKLLTPTELRMALYLLEPLAPAMQDKATYLYFLCVAAWHLQRDALAIANVPTCLEALQKLLSPKRAPQTQVKEKIGTLGIVVGIHDIIHSLLDITLCAGLDTSALTQIITYFSPLIEPIQHLGIVQQIWRHNAGSMYRNLASVAYRNALPYIKKTRDVTALTTYAYQVLLPLHEIALAVEQMRLAASYGAPPLLYELIALLKLQLRECSLETHEQQKIWQEIGSCYTRLIQARVPHWQLLLPLLQYAWQQAANPKQALHAYKALCCPAGDETQAPLQAWEPLLHFYAARDALQPRHALLSLLTQQYASTPLSHSWRQAYADYLHVALAHSTHSLEAQTTLQAQLCAATTFGALQPLLRAVLQAPPASATSNGSLASTEAAMLAEQISLLAHIQSGQTGIAPLQQPTPKRAARPRQSKTAHKKALQAKALAAQQPAPAPPVSSPPPTAAATPPKTRPAASLHTQVVVDNVTLDATLCGTDFSGALFARSTAGTFHHVSGTQALENWQRLALSAQYGVAAANIVPHSAALSAAIEVLGRRFFTPQLSVRDVMERLCRDAPYQLLFARDTVMQLWRAAAEPSPAAYLATLTQLELVFNGPPQWLWSRCEDVLPEQLRQDSLAAYAMQQGNVQLRGGSAAQPLLLSCASMRFDKHVISSNTALFGATLPPHTTCLDFSCRTLAADFEQTYDATGRGLADLQARRLHITAVNDYTVGWRALVFLLSQPNYTLTPDAARRVQLSLAQLRFPIEQAKAILRAKPAAWASQAAVQTWLSHTAKLPLLQSSLASAAKRHLEDPHMAALLWRLYSAPRGAPSAATSDA